MYKQRNKNAVENKPENNPVLKDYIAQQLLGAYAAGVQAIQAKEDELANIISYHIFDLLDWVRKNQFDIQANLTQMALSGHDNDRGRSAVSNAWPSSIQELETWVDEKFCSDVGMLDADMLPIKPSEREALC